MFLLVISFSIPMPLWFVCIYLQTLYCTCCYTVCASARFNVMTAMVLTFHDDRPKPNTPETKYEMKYVRLWCWWKFSTLFTIHPLASCIQQSKDSLFKRFEETITEMSWVQWRWRGLEEHRNRCFSLTLLVLWVHCFLFLLEERGSHTGSSSVGS